MYKRAHHQRINQILTTLNAPLLEKTGCYFAGGTAIVLMLDEYRESVDIDFLCASHEGYSTLRNCITPQSLGDLVTSPVNLLREIRADRYGIRTFVNVDDTPIKLEIVFEARIPLSAQMATGIPVPVLADADLMAEKLLANTDRGMDVSTWNRDMIDLAILAHHRGNITESTWQKCRHVYGDSVVRAFENSRNKLRDPAWLSTCLQKLQIDASYKDIILVALERQNPDG